MYVTLTQFIMVHYFVPLMQNLMAYTLKVSEISIHYRTNNILMIIRVDIKNATILQYINIRIAVSIAAIQYNTPDKNIDILLIAIYCNILQHLLPSKL